MNFLTDNIYNILLKLKVDSLSRFINKGKCSVLMYHGVVPDDCPIDAWTLVKESEFRKQMNILAQFYEVIPISNIKESCLEGHGAHKPKAVITFDDGYKNNYSVAFPILKEFGFSAAIFVCSGFLNEREMTWYDKVIYSIQRSFCDHINIEDRRYFFNYSDHSKRWDSIQELLSYLKTKSQVERSEFVNEIFKILTPPLDQTEFFSFLSDEEVRLLHRSGLITMGAHTAGHEILTNIQLEQAEKTIQKSLNDIELLIGQKVKYFSYPNGNYSTDILSILYSNQIFAAFTTVNDLYSERYDMLEIPRIGIGGYDGLNHFILNLSGFETLKRLKNII